MIDIPGALAIFSAASNLTTIATAIKDWLFDSQNDTSKRSEIEASLALLPPSANQNEIVNAIYPIFIAKGGNVKVTGGDNGGGDINLSKPFIEGGAGHGGGGDVVIKGGDGGPNGNGGNISIVGGVIKGGDAN